MKKICITFHMEKPGRNVETGITLKAKDELAAIALEQGVDASPMLKDTLKHIAALQGYRYTSSCYLIQSDVQDVEE